MNILEIVTVILGGGVLISFLMVICGQGEISIKVKVLAGGFCLSIIALGFYYDKQSNKDQERLAVLQGQISVVDQPENLLFTTRGKTQMMDSLKKIDGELDELFVRLQKRERIVGIKSEDVVHVKDMMQKTNRIIDRIKNYNETIDSAVYDDYSKGFISKETSLFTLIPPANTNAEYLDFGIQFHNEDIISKIAVIYIEVYKLQDKDKSARVYG